MQNQPHILTADEIAYSVEKGIPLTDNHDYQHDPDFKQWFNDLTYNILDGVFPRSTNEENQEALEYLQKHQTKKLDIDISSGIIMLFEPAAGGKRNFDNLVFTLYDDDIDDDSDEEEPKDKNKFIEEEDPHIEVKEHPSKLYCNYYYNKIQSVSDIYKLLKKVDKKESFPFKIDFDCGFIIEDSKTLEYEASKASEDHLGKSVPMVIRTYGDLLLYKHLVFATLGEYTNEVHVRKGGSRFHYIAIHSIMFQVTRLKDSGAKFLVPGYDFLVKNKYIIDYGNDYNLCMFYVVANTKK